MLDFNSLFEFSRSNCISICAFLVPANLLATSQTLLLMAFRRSSSRVWRSVSIASLLALVMVLHVMTWFLVGVVMAPTYILLTLGGVCLGINLWAIGHPSSLTYCLVNLLQRLQGVRLRMGSSS